MRVNNHSVISLGVMSRSARAVSKTSKAFYRKYYCPFFFFVFFFVFWGFFLCFVVAVVFGGGGGGGGGGGFAVFIVYELDNTDVRLAFDITSEAHLWSFTRIRALICILQSIT